MKWKWLRDFLAGMGSITVYPQLPEINLGDLSDDWKAVGNDIRSAIEEDNARCHR